MLDAAPRSKYTDASHLAPPSMSKHLFLLKHLFTYLLDFQIEVVTVIVILLYKMHVLQFGLIIIINLVNQSRKEKKRKIEAECRERDRKL